MAQLKVTVAELSRADCRKEKFSGIRSDRILENMEIWIEGVMKEEVTAEAVAVNPQAVVEAYARALGLHPEQVKLGTML